MKHWYFVVIIYLLPLIAQGQNDYYTTNSTLTLGIELVNGGRIQNSQFCQVKDEMDRKYSPYEVSMFGFLNGAVYLSKEIQLSGSIQKVFLERLVYGSTSLYFLKRKGIKTFFIEKDSSLFVELPKKGKGNVSFNNQLLGLTTDCKYIADAVKLAGYNRNSLNKLITRYNNCEFKPFPFFRYGVTFGYEFVKLNPTFNQDNSDINQISFKYDGGFTAGLFIDKPILVTDFSLHTELSYSRHGFSANKTIADKDLDFVANFSSLKLPVMIRYAYPSNQLRPFINIGVVSTYNFNNENSLYKTIKTQNVIEYNETNKISYIGDYHMGYAIGGGIEYKLNYRNSIFFEIRDDHLFQLSDSSTMDISGFKFMASINL